MLTASEEKTIDKLNYDLNIWDEGSHLTCHLPESEQYSQWKISFHDLERLSDGHIQCGDWIGGLEIFLDEDEVKALTLGWGTDLGGDYAPDSDFFMDMRSFFDVYKDIPQAVKEKLLALPPIDIRQSAW